MVSLFVLMTLNIQMKKRKAIIRRKTPKALVTQTIAYVQENQSKIKIGLYVALGFILMYGLIWLTTPKPTMPPDLKATIDSLAKVNAELTARQDFIDSTIGVYEMKANKIDVKINSVKNNIAIIREQYRDQVQVVSTYTPTQVDSFFKARYNY